MEQPSHGIALPSMTSDQLRILQEVEKELSSEINELWDHQRLYRFCAARNFDKEKVKEMIRGDIKWRKEHNVDTILETFPRTKQFQEFLDYWPGIVHGVDKEGIIVYYERIGKADPKSIFHNLSEQYLLDFHVWTTETRNKELYEVWKKNGKMSEGFITVLDCTDLGWKHMHSGALGALKKISQIDALHYPETMKRTYVINTPSTFAMFWKILKPFIDPRTLQKIVIVTGSGLDSILHDINKDQIPTFVGGESHCEHLLKSGGIFGSAGKRNSAEEESWEEVQIHAKDKFNLKFNLTKDSLITYRFKAESKDVGFVILHSSPQQKLMPLIPYAKHESGGVVEGQISVPSDGEYVLEWDNSFSVLRKKKIFYWVVIGESNSEEQ